MKRGAQFAGPLYLFFQIGGKLCNRKLHISQGFRKLGNLFFVFLLLSFDKHRHINAGRNRKAQATD